jgi:hypothetical protein
MSFEEATGDFTLHASEDAVGEVRRYVNEEFRTEDAGDVAAARVVDLCIAVGIAENEQRDAQSEYRTGAGSVDEHRVLRTLIEQRHDGKSGEELREIMREYFEGGAQLISQEITDKGYFEIERYLPEEVAAESS